MLPDNELYPYSIPVDREKVVASGALTSLPVRIHRYDHLSDAGALCLTKDWRDTMKDGQDRKSNGSPCVVGNWGSFIWPESEPERLGLLCYLLDAGCFHDDACEEMGIDDAHQEHLDMEAAMDVEDVRTFSSDSRSLKTKQLISAAVLECIKVDREGALRMLEAYRKKWLRIMETYNTEEINNVPEYFLARANNGGMGAYYAMLEFALGIVVTDEEYELMAEPIAHVERCMLLTNDYWSWPRERKQAEFQEAGKVFNIVWFLMKTEGCTEKEAMSKVHAMVHAEEQDWVESKTRFYNQNPNVRPDLVKFLENLHTALAGNDYWSSQCYRHNDWEHIPELPSDDDPKLHELADLGRMLRTESIPAKVLTLGPKSNEDSATISTRKPSVDDSSSSGSQSIRNESSSTEGSATAESNSSISGSSSPTRKDFTEEDIPSQPIALNPASYDSSVLTEPIKYIKSMPSKNLRTQLIDCFQIWLETPDSAMGVIKEVVDNLHQSSLILDDLEDGSQLRRGFPATHIVYGPSQAVNSATYLYVQAVESVHAAARDHPEMMDVFLKHLKHLFHGQSWDLYWTYHRHCPTEEQYLDMVDQKTGAMLQLLVGLMSQQRVQSGKLVNGDVLIRFAQLFGRYFQVRDDYMNLTSIDYARQKGFAEDLDEQKYSYLIVHMYQRHPQARDKFEGIFKAMKQSAMPQVAADTSKKYLLSILEETGSIAATKAMLIQWFDEIMEEIGALETHFGVDNMLLRLLVETLRIS
ncbi:geranylgeranyl pyrophosphate synthetase [Bimuria novae-zelandiae CBS 107.79]|uniref:geranylgeranyl diphosphate synthase n=1 Tax=Bimuria novae-zelandiae CBS 107.79 TaxID=1447943 RepID=A0A6A5VR80_9PLEO|nr:geranylgeranyl pyrophosphate synthetase [Bimuria novae-zelandiae CBS 107.79]